MPSKEELLAKKAEREAKREAEYEMLQVQALELEQEYEDKGKRLGVDFAVFTSLIGNFVVGKPEFLVAKKFSDAKEPSVIDVVNFVDGCVLYPARDIARGVFQEHGGVAWKLAAEAMKLYSAEAGEKRGKS